MSKILINIAWPYANGPIHLGHVAGSILPPDIFSRYHRLLGDQVLMVGGSDQHGTPITVSAEKEGVTPEVIAERYHEINKKAIEGLGIEYTLYNKTHCPTHVEVTQWMFNRLRENGFIYPVEEDEYYCPKCAKFLPDRYVEGECPKCGAKNVRSDQCDSCGTTFVPGDIIKPYCTRCGAEPEVKASKQFALKLSAFEKPLLESLAKNTHWRPNVKAFTENFLKGGLKDRSITRDMSWGIPIPVEGDEWKSKVIYVWFDAVIGYLSASVEYSKMIGKPDYWKEFWKDPECKSYYFIGKDNIPFHSIIWPAMLMGAQEGFNQPYDIPANEYLMFNGGKLSKSRKGASGGSTADIPRDIPHVLEKFDPEEIRYYLSVTMPDMHDTDFTWEDLETKVNNELVAALGNLYHRCISFTQKNFGTVPSNPSPDAKVDAAIKEYYDAYNSHLEGCDFKKAIQDVMALAHFGNEYFNSCAPWKLIKEDKEACGRVLADNIRIVKALAVMAWPFMPKSSEKIWGFLGLQGTLEEAGYKAVFEPIPEGTVLKESVPVYGKIDLKALFPELFAEPAKEEKPKAAEPFDSFKKLDLRVGKVLTAGDHPNADKLFMFTIDFGTEQRTICSGIKAYYKAEDLVGKKVIAVFNLAPRMLRGVESCGMLLTAEDSKGNLALLEPSDDAAPGTRYDCGFGGEKSTIDYNKHFAVVKLRLSSVKDGKFVSEDVPIDVPAGAPSSVAAVIDGGRALPLGDGKKSVATVGRPIGDGAEVR